MEFTRELYDRVTKLLEKLQYITEALENIEFGFSDLLFSDRTCHYPFDEVDKIAFIKYLQNRYDDIACELKEIGYLNK